MCRVASSRFHQIYVAHLPHGFSAAYISLTYGYSPMDRRGYSVGINSMPLVQKGALCHMYGEYVIAARELLVCSEVVSQLPQDG